MKVSPGSSVARGSVTGVGNNPPTILHGDRAVGLADCGDASSDAGADMGSVSRPVFVVFDRVMRPGTKPLPGLRGDLGTVGERSSGSISRVWSRRTVAARMAAALLRRHCTTRKAPRPRRAAPVSEPITAPAMAPPEGPDEGEASG